MLKMMRCSSGKNGYDTMNQAEDALIENHIRYHHKANSGPINIYLCNDCGEYHFTSKGEVNPILEEKQSFIQSERLAREWETKLR